MKREVRRPSGIRCHPLNGLGSWFVALLVILSAVRGAVVLNFNLSASQVYQTTAALLLGLGCYGILRGNAYRRCGLGTLRSLLKLSLLLGIINTVIDISLGASFDPGVILRLMPFLS
jgi:hypothetical protein